MDNGTTINHQYDIIGAILRLFGGSDIDGASFMETLGFIWDVYTVLAYIISALLLFGTIYAMVRWEQLHEQQTELLREEEHAFAHAKGTSTKDQKWNIIKAHSTSDNPNDWRLAIIEADIMLDDALNKAGYVGASIGDKLKTANRNAFASLQNAWDAHKVRNQIAHSGSDFVLTKKIVNETINQYERVFEELRVI